MPPLARAFLVLTVLALVGSCVSSDSPTSVGQSPPARLAFQPSIIPTPADGDALPVNRIRVVVVRDPDSALLADSTFTVQPTDTAWTLDMGVRLQTSPTQARLRLYLLNQAPDGTRTVQFSGLSDVLALSAGQTTSPADVPIVRGPLDNLFVTGVSITSVAPTVVEGQTTALAATVTTSPPSAAPTVYWTSLDTQVVRIDSTTAIGVTTGTADVVASAGAFADTTTVTVVPAVDSVLVSPDSADVMVGATTTYTAELFDSSGGTLSGRPIAWSTGSSSIASVNPTTGVVTGVAAGTTTVTATSEGVSDAAKVVVVPMPAGTGAQNTWIANGGLWSTPTSWSLGRVPIPGDTVLLTQNDDYAVTLDTDVTVARLDIGGTVDLITLYTDNYDLTLTDPGPSPAVHIGPLGNLDISQGTVSADVILDEGSFWSRAGVSIVSDSVVIAAGAFWTVASGSALTLSHPDVPYLWSEGTLTVEGGAAMSVNDGGDLSYAGGSIGGNGVLTLNTGSQLLLYADLTIDGLSLHLQEAATVAVTASRLTLGPGTSLTLSSTVSSQASVENVLVVQGILIGSGPQAYVDDSLYVEAGANVSVGAGTYLGTVDVVNSGTIGLSGSGVATFGPGGTTNRRILNLPSGVLDLQANGMGVIDGELINEGTILIGGPSLVQRENVFGTPVSAQHVNAGTIMVNGDFTVELGGSSPSFTNQGTINVFASRTLTVNNLSDGAIVNDVTGVLTGLGTVDVTPGAVVGLNYGSIYPNHDLTPSGGVMSWIGSVPMAPGGTLDFTLEGTTPGTEHDQLNVTDSLLFDASGSMEGTLVVDTINGFEPSPGDRFAIMTFRGRSGAFADVSLPTIAGVALDTVWAEAGSVDTLYIEATSATAAPLNRWTGLAGDGVWSSAGNWSTGALPADGDSVVIDLDGANVLLSQPDTLYWLTLGGTSNATTLVNEGWTLTVDGGADIGAFGVLSIPNGGSLAGSGTLTNLGLVEMAGIVINQLAVANQGTWNLLDGGSVTQNQPVDNSGVITMTSDSQPTTGMAIAGDLTNSGLITLEDASTSIARPDLRVNSGTLYNLASGVIQTAGVGTQGAFLRAPIDNQGTINVPVGLPLGVTPSFGVSHSNSGTINGGARIAFTNVDAFVNTGSIDGSKEFDITMTGAGTGFVNSGDLITGVGSTVVAGVGSDITGGSFENTAAGTVTVLSGSTLLLHHTIVNEGAFSIEDGATLVLSGGATNADGGTLAGYGSVDVTNTTAGDLAGEVVPGDADAVGTLSWLGDYEPTSTHKLTLELAGPGEADLLDISGQTDASLTFAGTLVIDTLNYVPVLADTFPVITFGDRATSFDAVVFPTLAGVTLDTLWTNHPSIAAPDTLFIVVH